MRILLQSLSEAAIALKSNNAFESEIVDMIEAAETIFLHTVKVKNVSDKYIVWYLLANALAMGNYTSDHDFKEYV